MKILLFVTWDALHYLYSCLISFLFPFLWAMQLIKLTSGFSSHWTIIKFCDEERIWDWLYLKVLLAKTNYYSLVKKNAYSCGELSHPTLQDPYQMFYIPTYFYICNKLNMLDFFLHNCLYYPRPCLYMNNSDQGPDAYCVCFQDPSLQVRQDFVLCFRRKSGLYWTIFCVITSVILH